MCLRETVIKLASNALLHHGLIKDFQEHNIITVPTLYDHKKRTHTTYITSLFLFIKFMCVCSTKVDMWNTSSSLNQIKDIKDTHLRRSTVINHHLKQMFPKNVIIIIILVLHIARFR